MVLVLSLKAADSVNLGYGSPQQERDPQRDNKSLPKEIESFCIRSDSPSLHTYLEGERTPKPADIIEPVRFPRRC